MLNSARALFVNNNVVSLRDFGNHRQPIMNRLNANMRVYDSDWKFELSSTFINHHDHFNGALEGAKCCLFFFCLLQSFSALPVAAWKEMAKLLKPIVMKKSRWKPAPKSTLFVRQFRITWVHSLVIAPTKWITVSRGTIVTFSKTAKRQSALSPVVWLSRVIFLCVRYRVVILFGMPQ